MKIIGQFFILLFIFSSCIVNIDPELETDSNIVLNGIIVPGELVHIYLHHSRVGYDSLGFEPVDNAEVKLTINKESVEYLKPQGDGLYVSSKIAQEFTSYRIEVATINGVELWAETRTPEEDFNVIVQSQHEVDSLRDNNWPFYLTLVDNVASENFYWIGDLQYELTPDSVSTHKLAFSLFSNTKYADGFNVSFDPGGYGRYNFEYEYFIHLTDDLFNVDTIQFYFIPTINGSLKQDSLIVFNMDVHYSNYLKSKLMNDKGSASLDENIAPINYNPAFLYSNVHGGMGILGSYTCYSKAYNY